MQRSERIFETEKVLRFERIPHLAIRIALKVPRRTNVKADQTTAFTQKQPVSRNLPLEVYRINRVPL